MRKLSARALAFIAVLALLAAEPSFARAKAEDVPLSSTRPAVGAAFSYREATLTEGVQRQIVYDNNLLPDAAAAKLAGADALQGLRALANKSADASSDTVEGKVAQLAEACRAAGMTTDYDIALWMHDWLTANANYDYTYTEYYADGVLLKGTGVCQSYALAYRDLLEAMGVECRLVVSETMKHAWNLIKVDGQWSHVDVTWDDPGTGGMEYHAYFGLSDKLMARDHTWDQSAYPACASDAANYYLRGGGCVVVTTEAEFKSALSAQIAQDAKEIMLYDLSEKGLDMDGALSAWWTEEGMYCALNGYKRRGGGGMMLFTPYYSGKNVCVLNYYGDVEALRSDLVAALSRKRETFQINDRRDGTFAARSLYLALRELIKGYAAEYGCVMNGSYSSIESYRRVTMSLTYLSDDDALDAEPFPLASPVDGVRFKLTLEDGSRLTNADYEGHNALMVYATSTSDYTVELLLALNAYAPLLDEAGIQLIVAMHDLEATEELAAFSTVYKRLRFALSDVSSMWRGLEKFGQTGAQYLPVVFLRDSDGKLAYYSTGRVSEPERLVAAALSLVPSPATRLLLTLPAGLGEVGENAFENGTGFNEVAFAGDKTTAIGARAFKGCAALRLITIPDSVTFIGENAFEGCSRRLVIVCGEDSAARRYAEANGIRWRTPE